MQNSVERSIAGVQNLIVYVVGVDFDAIFDENRFGFPLTDCPGQTMTVASEDPGESTISFRTL